VQFRAILDWYIAVLCAQNEYLDAEPVQGHADRAANRTSVRDHQYAAFLHRR